MVNAESDNFVKKIGMQVDEEYNWENFLFRVSLCNFNFVAKESSVITF